MRRLIILVRNDFERLCSLYLRLNGFFHFSDFTVHKFDEKEKKWMTEEIDFIGVRFPESSETPIYTNGRLLDTYFEDDSKLVARLKNNLIVLIGEATISTHSHKITERINKLNDTTRINYAIQRFGLFKENKKLKVLRVLFVISEKLMPKNVGDIQIMTYSDIAEFIEQRAEHITKQYGVALLPEGFQQFVTVVRKLRLEETV